MIDSGPSWGPPTSGRGENPRELTRGVSAPQDWFHGQLRGQRGPRERSPLSTKHQPDPTPRHGPRPVQRLAATGRAKYVPDAAVADGVQRGATGTPIVAPRRWSRPAIPGQGPFLQRGGSRIRTLEGISRRIYNPLVAG
jgi:hypothetical protein